MIALKLFKSLSLGVGGVLGVLIALVLFVAVWVGLAMVLAIPLGWVFMIVFGVVHSIWAVVPALGFLPSWLIVTALAMLCGA